MATQLSKTVDEATDQVVSIIEQAQDAASSVVRSVSEAVAEYVPELGLGEITSADGLDERMREAPLPQLGMLRPQAL